MESKFYWEYRETERLYNSTLGIAEEQLAEEYLRVFKKLQTELLALYGELTEEAADKILVSDLFRFNRYYDLLNELQQSLQELGIREEILYENLFLEYYKQNWAIIGGEHQWALPLSDEQVKSAINAIWCGDGKNWSDRIWSNKALLQERVKQGIVDSIAAGAGKDQLVKRLMEDMNVGFHQADRIARTELAYIRNKSTLDRYEQMGEDKYEILANQADDETCGGQDGQVYLISDAEVGVNFPPFHPNCKCCIIPVRRGG